MLVVPEQLDGDKLSNDTTNGAMLRQEKTQDQDNEHGFTTESLISSLFYLKNEKPQRSTYCNNVGKVIHKSMLYKCVDSHGPHKRIIVDLLDIIEHPAKSCS